MNATVNRMIRETFSKQATFELRKRQISGMCIPEKGDRKYDCLHIWVS